MGMTGIEKDTKIVCIIVMAEILVGIYLTMFVIPVVFAKSYYCTWEWGYNWANCSIDGTEVVYNRDVDPKNCADRAFVKEYCCLDADGFGCVSGKQLKDHRKIIEFLSRYKDQEFVTPLSFDIMEILGFEEGVIKDLMDEYGSFIPVARILELNKQLTEGNHPSIHCNCKSCKRATDLQASGGSP